MRERRRYEHYPSNEESNGVACIPAFGLNSLTPLYDFMMKWAARESTFKPRLVEQARIEKNYRVLDLGCGTATLTILIKKVQPEGEVIGLDADPAILEIAKSKIADTGLDIALDQGTATELPYPDSSFDRVFSSMVLHHLTMEGKVHALREALRVLKHRGELHVADLGKPQNVLMRFPSLIIAHLEKASDNLKGLLPQLMRTAGFDNVEETARYMTVFGTVVLYKAQKPLKTSRNKTNAMNEDAKITLRSRGLKARDEEERYYLLLKKYARILVPFYDTVFGSLTFGAESRLRRRVVDFAGVPNGSKILDVATGTGKQAFAFAEKGYDIVGIDLSEDMLNVAKKNNKYDKARFEVADATSLPFDDNTFDLSCVSFALHDMIPVIREKALKEMVRVTRPNGTIVIVDYSLPKNKTRRFLFYNIVKLYEPYYTEFIKSDFEMLVRNSGIKIEKELSVLLGAGRILRGTKSG